LAIVGRNRRSLVVISPQPKLYRPSDKLPMGRAELANATHAKWFAEHRTFIWNPPFLLSNGDLRL